MRFLICLLLGFAVAGRSAGQGTLNFANGAAGVNAPVNLPDGNTPVTGADWHAELLLVGPNGDAQSIAGPISFSSDVSGYFFGGLVTVPGVSLGEAATFRVRVSDKLGFSDGFSKDVTVTLGGDKMPPANLVGLTSWTVTARVSDLAISLVDGRVNLSWPQTLVGAALETSPSLTTPNWTAVTEAPVPTGDNFSVSLPLSANEGYFRIRLPRR